MIRNLPQIRSKQLRLGKEAIFSHLSLITCRIAHPADIVIPIEFFVCRAAHHNASVLRSHILVPSRQVELTERRRLLVPLAITTR